MATNFRNSNESDHSEDIIQNHSDNESFGQVLERARLGRRGFLKGSSSLVAASMLGTGLAFLTEAVKSENQAATAAPGLKLGFNPVSKSITDVVSVPPGYTAKTLLVQGDPIKSGISPYKNNGTDVNFDLRVGDHHDGIHYFGLNRAGNAWDPKSNDRAILCVNHEVAEDLGWMHENGPTSSGDKNTGIRPTIEIDREVAAHGVTIVELARRGSAYQVNLNSRFNRRVTGETLSDITGPARGNALMVTSFSPTGERTRGIVNLCGHGYTPWGTYLTCEENWSGYFHRREEDATRSEKEIASFKRYGIGNATSGRYNWSRTGSQDGGDRYQRWSVNKIGTSPVQDFRNVANTFGWVVEIDPFNPNANPRKRTSIGRFAHEGAWPSLPKAGQPVVIYSGDDSRNEYIYKFVSAANWDPKDANGGFAAGDKYLNSGTLYVAKFNDDGSGEWLPLTMNNSKIANYSKYSFADQADVLINARIAADAVGATKMDRPEWGAVNPLNGEVYMTLTNNSRRGDSAKLDAANPRFYADQKGSTTNRGNVNGHIIRWRESGSNASALTFNWDVYLFGAQADAEKDINISRLSNENDFSSPDGLWFSTAVPGLLWVQTDDGAYTDVTNCMMLAALPGKVGDGGAITISNKSVPTNDKTDQSVRTFVGQAATPRTLRRFLVGPRDAEITGITESPDGKAIFVNIQHPGENSKSATDPAQFTSHWPDGGNSRPRSATIIITKNDGGVIGS